MVAAYVASGDPADLLGALSRHDARHEVLWLLQGWRGRETGRVGRCGTNAAPGRRKLLAGLGLRRPIP